MPTPDTQEAHDAFIRGFHGIPNKERLRAMSDVELASLLASCEKGSAKFFVVEQEMVRRANADNAKVVSSATEKRWVAKPLGMLAIGAAGSLLAWAVLKIFGLG